MYISNIFVQVTGLIELWTSFKAAVSVANSLYGLLWSDQIQWGSDTRTFLFLPNLHGLKVKAIRSCSLLEGHDHHSTNMQSMIYCMVFRLNTVIKSESAVHLCYQGHHRESLFSIISTYLNRKQFSIQMFTVTPDDYNVCHYIRGSDTAVELPKCCILHIQHHKTHTTEIKCTRDQLHLQPSASHTESRAGFGSPFWVNYPFNPPQQ